LVQSGHGGSFDPLYVKVDELDLLLGHYSDLQLAPCAGPVIVSEGTAAMTSATAAPKSALLISLSCFPIALPV
jgi:hypothetical protein